jgi:hypothetical protein
MEYLISAGVATRTRVQFQGTISSGSGEFFIAAQQAVFEKHDSESPGQWSLAQLSTTPYFSDSVPKLSIEYQLWNRLPIPSSDVPLNEILEFKAKRQDELVALRIYLDEMYQSIISAADIPRAKNTGLAKLETALDEIDRVLAESGITRTISSLRGFIAGEFGTVSGTGLGAAGISPYIGMPPLEAGAVGAGIAFAVRMAMVPRPIKNTNPLTYVSSIRREL